MRSVHGPEYESRNVSRIGKKGTIIRAPSYERKWAQCSNSNRAYKQLSLFFDTANCFSVHTLYGVVIGMYNAHTIINTLFFSLSLRAR